MCVLTNDSTVFLRQGVASVFEMFGGRCQEVKNLVARLDLAVKESGEKKGEKLCEVSFGIISSRFGFVPADYMVMNYPPESVMSKPEDYERLQKEKDFLGSVAYSCTMFDRIVVCVPKHMMKMIMDANILPNGRVMAVTSPELKDECAKRDWMWLERKGPRVGSGNSDLIMAEIRRISE